jgi:hypothetical protein
MTFGERLQAVMQKGNLTIADLSRWFERPYPTVRGWKDGQFEPGGAPLDIAMVLALLTKLEMQIRRKEGFPVPPLTPTARIEYLEKIRRKK